MSIIKSKHIILNDIKKIAILADCGCVKDWEEHFPKFLECVWEQHSPDLFIIIGDLVLRAGFFHYIKLLKYLKQFPAKWIAVPGNHDKPQLVFNLFFGSSHKIIDIDKWRFIGINTSNKKLNRKEANWLDYNIKENSIIMTHVPPSFEGWSFYSLPESSSNLFFDIVKKNRDNIAAMFFGHIHGLSENEYLGIPMTITGGAAQSKIIKNNKYNDNDALEMIIFDVKSGEKSIVTQENVIPAKLC